MTQATWPHGLALTALGVAALVYGLFLNGLRRWDMRRLQRESGADMVEVETWFKPGRGRLSDLLRRGATLGIAYPLIVCGTTLIFNRKVGLPAAVATPVSSAVVMYSLGLSVLLALTCGGLLCVFCAGKLAAGNVLLALPRSGYDYAKAQRHMSGYGKAGPSWTISIRLLGVLVLGIAWFVGSTIADHLAPHLQAWFGK